MHPQYFYSASIEYQNSNLLMNSEINKLTHLSVIFSISCIPPYFLKLYLNVLNSKEVLTTKHTDIDGSNKKHRKESKA